MTRAWAEAHEEEISLPFYVRSRDEPGKCKNPHCGHVPLYNIWVMRHEESGAVQEIGTHCHQRWLRLRGYATDPWFEEYEANLISIGRTQRGVRITGRERRQIRKDSRKTWIFKRIKKGLMKPLHRIDMPLENFRTKELAEEWAVERGGYLSGTIEHHGKKKWCIYVNPNYRGEY